MDEPVNDGRRVHADRRGLHSPAEFARRMFISVKDYVRRLPDCDRGKDDQREKRIAAKPRDPQVAVTRCHTGEQNSR